MTETKGGSLNNSTKTVVNVAREAVLMTKNKATKERLNRIWESMELIFF